MLVSLVSRYLTARSAYLGARSGAGAAAAWSAMSDVVAEAHAAGLGPALVDQV